MMQKIDTSPTANSEDEIRVTNQGRAATYVAYAGRLLEDMQKPTITIRASGLATSVAILAVELLKERFPDLHQETKLGITRLVEEFIPGDVPQTGEEGAPPPTEASPTAEEQQRMTRVRVVPFVLVVLSRSPALLNTSAPGYQAPTVRPDGGRYPMGVPSATSRTGRGLRGRGGFGRGSSQPTRTSNRGGYYNPTAGVQPQPLYNTQSARGNGG